MARNHAAHLSTRDDSSVAHARHAGIVIQNPLTAVVVVDAFIHAAWGKKHTGIIYVKMSAILYMLHASLNLTQNLVVQICGLWYRCIYIMLQMQYMSLVSNSAGNHGTSVYCILTLAITLDTVNNNVQKTFVCEDWLVPCNAYLVGSNASHSATHV